MFFFQHTEILSERKNVRQCLLGTGICWKSPNINHFDIKWSENCNIELELYLCPGVLQWRYKVKGYNQRLRDAPIY